MKKMLLATSALVAMMAAAPQAGAQQVSTKAPFEVTLDGWASVYMGAVPTEQNNANQRAYDLKDDIHLIFDAHSKADNGLLYGVFIRSDFDTTKVTNRNEDRANIYFQGDWGRLEAGDNQPVQYKFAHLNVIKSGFTQQAGDGAGFNNGNSSTSPLESVFLRGSANAAPQVTPSNTYTVTDYVGTTIAAGATTTGTLITGASNLALTGAAKANATLTAKVISPPSGGAITTTTYTIQPLQSGAGVVYGGKALTATQTVYQVTKQTATTSGGASDLALGIGNLGYLGDYSVSSANASKLTYLTPKIEGFQAGLSYTPEGTSRGGQTVNRSNTAAVSTTSGSASSLSNYTDIVEAAISYKNQYDLGFGPLGVYSVISATYGRAKGAGVFYNVGFGKGSQTSTATDINSYYGGFNFTYAGFTPSFGLTYNGHSQLAKAGDYHSDATGYAIGLQYEVGPWTISSYYHDARYGGATVSQTAAQTGGNAINGASGDHLQDQEIGVGYLLAPGLLLSASGYNFDYRDDGAILQTGTTHRYGQVYLVGSSITF